MKKKEKNDEKKKIDGFESKKEKKSPNYSQRGAVSLEVTLEKRSAPMENGIWVSVWGVLVKVVAITSPEWAINQRRPMGEVKAMTVPLHSPGHTCTCWLIHC